ARLFSALRAEIDSDLVCAWLSASARALALVNASWVVSVSLLATSTGAGTDKAFQDSVLALNGDFISIAVEFRYAHTGGWVIARFLFNRNFTRSLGYSAASWGVATSFRLGCSAAGPPSGSCRTTPSRGSNSPIHACRSSARIVSA